MKLLLIACSLLLSSALIAQDSVQTTTTDIQVSADNADKNIDRLYYNFGTIPVNAVSYASYTVTNVGNQPLAFRQARIAGPGYYARTNCNVVLYPGMRCGFTIEFRPYFQGYSSGQFMMSFDPNYSVIVDLAGQAVRY
ncbi:MAG: hypothetical protein H7177_06070 [Rhizobacter sp.]|nr:hypothetical protein [Bacteriovorax sp.]